MLAPDEAFAGALRGCRAAGLVPRFLRTACGNALVGFDGDSLYHLPATPQRTPHVPGLDRGSHQAVAGGNQRVIPLAEAVVAAFSDL